MKLGTSSVVVAAFVGPGTVLTCASAGVTFGYSLGWVLLFATASVFVLQSLTAGLGILTRKGLGDALREATDSPLPKALIYAVVILGLWVGCAAFESGNLIGAATGVTTVLGGDIEAHWIVLLLGIGAGSLLMLNLSALTQALGVLVTSMGILFLLTMFLAPVSWSDALEGLFVPSIPDGSLLTVVALIGTTIVTYNLFLHAAATKEHWIGEDATFAWRRELLGMAIFLPIGGLISFAILVSGATLHGTGEEFSGVGGFANLLEPAVGPASRYLFGLGLLAAGLTSAVTAPLAAAAGIRELFNWPDDPKHLGFRAVWFSVLVVGMFFGMMELKPLKIIVMAQAANGVLLPSIAVFVLYAIVRRPEFPLPRWYLAAGGLVTIVCAGLGVYTIWKNVFA